MTNAEYWEQRMANTQKLARKNIDAKMKKLYKTLFNRLDSDLTKLWLDMMASGGISSSNLIQADRYRTMMEHLRKELSILANKNEEYIQTSLMDVFMDGWNAFTEFAGIPPEFAVMNEEVAKEVVYANYKTANFSERIWNNMEELKTKLTDAISTSAVAGYDVRKVAQELQKALNAGYNDSKRITITETSRVFNEACRKSALNTGYFKTYTLLLEASACDDCVKAYENGKHYPLEQSVLPLHPYCKCTMLIDLD